MSRATRQSKSSSVGKARGSRRRRGPPAASRGLSTTRARELVRRYRGGESIQAIAAATGLSERAVSAALHARGIKPTPKRLNLLPRAALVVAYVRRGLSSEAVAAELNCSSQKVRDDLRRYGIPLRPRRFNAGLAELDRDRLWTLYVEEGLPLEAIGARVGCTPSAVRNQMERFGIARRPRSSGRTRRIVDPRLSEAHLTELYVHRRRSTVSIAAELGCSRDTIVARLAEYGIPRRRPRQQPHPPLDPDVLRRLWAEERREEPEVAATLGVSRAWLRHELRRHGIRRPRLPPPGLVPVDPERVRELYVDRELSMRAVAGELGCSEFRVHKALRRAGIPARPAGSRPAGLTQEPTPELLEQLYVRQGLSATAIARQIGGSEEWVRKTLHRFAIPTRPRGQTPVKPLTISTSMLRQLYVTERLSDADIAARYDTNAWQVRQRLRSEGIRRPSPPPPHPPPVLTPPPEILEELYVRQGLPSVAIARRYHTSAHKVRAWLAAAGIPVAPRTTRATRVELSPSSLFGLYVHHELSIDDIALRVGVGRLIVRRSLHDYGIPVRPGGTPRGDPSGDGVRLLEELYGDRDVTELLRRHRIPSRPQPGPLARRFPTPFPLTVELLRNAYLEIGLAAHHIELLTGQPGEQVLDALHAAGIPVRTTQGASPWRRRLLAELRASSRRSLSKKPTPRFERTIRPPSAT